MPAAEAKAGYVELLRQLLPGWKSDSTQPGKPQPAGLSFGPVFSSLAGALESNESGEAEVRYQLQQHQKLKPTQTLRS